MTEKVLRCDCGFEVRADDDASFVSRVQEHAREAHGMDLTAEHVLRLAARSASQVHASDLKTQGLAGAANEARRDPAPSIGTPRSSSTKSAMRGKAQRKSQPVDGFGPQASAAVDNEGRKA